MRIFKIPLALIFLNIFHMACASTETESALAGHRPATGQVADRPDMSCDAPDADPAAACEQGCHCHGRQGFYVREHQTQGYSAPPWMMDMKLYGILDVNAVYRSHLDSSGRDGYFFGNGWYNGNRLGLVGSHEVNSDAKFIFKIENILGNQPDEVSSVGNFRSRDAWIGLESKTAGKITWGKQNSLARDSAASGIYGDPYGGEQANLDEGGYSHRNTFRQLVNYASGSTGPVINKGAVWKKAYEHLIVGLAYDYADNASGLTRRSAYTTSLAYNGSGYTVAGYLTESRINDMMHRVYSVGGNIAPVQGIRLYGGYYNYVAQQGGGVGFRYDMAYTFSANFAPSRSKFDYQIGFQSMQAVNAGLDASGNVLSAFANTSRVTRAIIGDRNSAYASMFYHVNQDADLYIAAVHLRTTRGYVDVQTNGFRNQNEFSMGMRYRF